MTEAVLPPQYGMICKPTALAALDAYYSALRGVPSIPIRKDHHAATEDSPAPEFSIRQVAKQFGSKQGEVLESHRFEAIAKGLGYEVRTIQPGSPEEFWDSVVANINEGKPLIVCFAVDRSTLLPSLEFDGVNEHGALIVNYQKDSRTVDLLHTQELFPNVDIELLFGSMQTLPEKREQEVYIRQPGGTVTWNNQPTWKYDFLDPDSVAPAQSDLVHSIVPEPGTGFKNKVFVFSPDAASTRWQPHPHQ